MRLCTGCLLWVKVFNFVGGGERANSKGYSSAQFRAWKGVVIVLPIFIKIWVILGQLHKVQCWMSLVGERV